MKTAGLQPGVPLFGELRVPGSKSIAQRALAAAAFAHGTTRFVGLPASADVVHGLRAAKASGARCPSERRDDDLLMTALLHSRGQGGLAGSPPDAAQSARPWCTVGVGESGTGARLYTALLALARPPGSGAEVRVEGSLLRRHSPALFVALRELGTGVEHTHGHVNGWPVLLTSPKKPVEARLTRPTSSQEVSALLFALAAWDGRAVLDVLGPIPSEPYVALSVRVLEHFSVGVEQVEVPGGRRWFIGGPLRAPSEPLIIEADASSAAVALAAGCLSGGDVQVSDLGVDSLQPDLVCIELLRAFGCHAEATTERVVARGRPTGGATVDLSASPDLAPVAAALAADVALRGLGASRIVGLGTLPGKESSRIAVLAGGLTALGVTATHGDDWLEVRPAGGGGGPGGPLLLDPAGDHRMAFAFALFGLSRRDVRVQDPGCVAKSWPTFWTDLAAVAGTP